MADALQTDRRLPGDVADLNAIAQRSGVEVTVSIAAEVAHIRWRGTEAQLRSTGSIKRSYRFPLTRGRLCLPHEEASWFRDEVGRSFIRGEIGADSDCARYTFDAQVLLPLEVSTVGGVEICRFSDRVSYYGPGEELVRTGLVYERQLPGKRSKRSPYCWRSDAGAAVRWRSRWHPSGNVIHYREADQVAAKRGGGRVQAKPVLETVLDRARGDTDFQRFINAAIGGAAKS